MTQDNLIKDFVSTDIEVSETIFNIGSQVLGGSPTSNS